MEQNEKRPIEVIHNAKENCFEAPGGARLEYTPDGGKMVFDHTFVPPEMRGTGVASVLAQVAFDHARAAGWKVVPACSYIATWVKRHRGYEDLIVPSNVLKNERTQLSKT